MQTWTSTPGKCVFCSFASYARLPTLRAQIRPFSLTQSRPRTPTKPSRAPRLKLQETPKFSKLGKQSSIAPFLDENAINQQLEKFRREIRNPPKNPADKLQQCIQLDPDLHHWQSFRDYVLAAVKGRDSSNLRSNLQRAIRRKGVDGILITLRASYVDHVALQKASKEEIKFQQRIADLRFPTEWFPVTRALQRHIHLHIGPTNSGKTYNALKRLEESKNGFYAGPLRLLAHEVYSRLNAKGIRCGLVTGDEVRGMEEDEEPPITCHTVEMVPLYRDVEVAVVDEIQMIGDSSRGWAWTNALLGARAKEVHVCGEARTAPLIRELTASMGDTLHIHQYERLNPLQAMKTSLKGNLKRLEKGDCLVCFTIIGLHAMKREIEVVTGRRCAIVYGSLPPEVRAQQAELFNNPDNDFDFLVASDAVGMGLNLSIKRVIFESTWKNDGAKMTQLSTSALKQIAGRAGRYRVASRSGTGNEETQQSSGNDEMIPGLVTSLSDRDLSVIQHALIDNPEPIKQAGLLPPSSIIEKFTTLHDPDTPFSYINRRLHNIALIHPRFFLCDIEQQCLIADAIQRVKNLTSLDRHTITASPAGVKFGAEDSGRVVGALARCIAGQSGNLLDIPEIELEVLDLPVAGDRKYLLKLEELHKALILYLWLSYRFAGIFTTRPMAFYAKSLVEEKIDQALLEFSANAKLRKQLIVDKQIRIEKQMKEQAALRENEDQTQKEEVGETDLEKGVEESRRNVKDSDMSGPASTEPALQESEGGWDERSSTMKIAEVRSPTSIDEPEAAGEEPLGAALDNRPTSSTVSPPETQSDSHEEITKNKDDGIKANTPRSLARRAAFDGALGGEPFRLFWLESRRSLDDIETLLFFNGRQLKRLRRFVNKKNMIHSEYLIKPRNWLEIQLFRIKVKSQRAFYRTEETCSMVSEYLQSSLRWHLMSLSIEEAVQRELNHQKNETSFRLHSQDEHTLGTVFLNQALSTMTACNRTIELVSRLTHDHLAKAKNPNQVAKHASHTNDSLKVEPDENKFSEQPISRSKELNFFL